jgi:hypothetical protein
MCKLLMGMNANRLPLLPALPFGIPFVTLTIKPIQMNAILMWPVVSLDEVPVKQIRLRELPTGENVPNLRLSSLN